MGRSDFQDWPKLDGGPASQIPTGSRLPRIFQGQTATMTSTGAGTTPRHGPRTCHRPAQLRTVSSALRVELTATRGEEKMTTDETPVVAFRRARKHYRSAWGRRIGTVRVNVPAREPIGQITEAERAVCR